MPLEATAVVHSVRDDDKEFVAQITQLPYRDLYRNVLRKLNQNAHPFCLPLLLSITERCPPQSQLAQVLHARREREGCRVDRGRARVLQAQTSKAAGAPSFQCDFVVLVDFLSHRCRVRNQRLTRLPSAATCVSLLTLFTLYAHNWSMCWFAGLPCCRLPNRAPRLARHVRVNYRLMPHSCHGVCS